MSFSVWHYPLGMGQLTLAGMPDRSWTPVRRRRAASRPLPVNSASSPMKYVLEFHEAFGLPIRTKPTIPISASEVDLRVRLIEEETSEFTEAAIAQRLIDIADALADIVYVTYGTALHYGINLDAALQEIHRANMSKLDLEGQALVRSDGKVLKGDTYEPPRLAAVLGLPDPSGPGEST